jgi:hypothetical protein
MSARAQHLERTVAALPRRAVAEPPVKEAKPAPAPSSREPVKEPPRGPVAPPVAIDATPPPSTSSLPHIPEPVAVPARPPAEHVVAPRPRVPEPVAQRPLPAAARTSEPAPSARLTAPSGRATIEAPARSSDGGAAMAKSEETRLPDKIREDWKTVRGGLSTAGDDFKAAVKDLGRKLWR